MTTAYLAYSSRSLLPVKTNTQARHALQHKLEVEKHDVMVQQKDKRHTESQLALCVGLSFCLTTLQTYILYISTYMGNFRERLDEHIPVTFAALFHF